MVPWHHAPRAQEAPPDLLVPEHVHVLLPPSEFDLNSEGSVSQRLVSNSRLSALGSIIDGTLPSASLARQSEAGVSDGSALHYTSNDPTLDSSRPSLAFSDPSNLRCPSSSVSNHHTPTAVGSSATGSSTPSGKLNQSGLLTSEASDAIPQSLQSSACSPAPTTAETPQWITAGPRIISEGIQSAEGRDAAAPLQSHISRFASLKRHMSHKRSASSVSMASDDFEHTAGPIASNGLGDATCSLPVSISITSNDPSNEAVLRIEVPGSHNRKAIRLVIAVGKSVNSASFMLLIVLFALKLKKDDSWFIRSPVLYQMNLVCGCVCLFAVLAADILIGRCIFASQNWNKHWSRRRAFFCGSSYLLLLIQTLNLAFFVLPNAWILSSNCAWFDSVVTWSATVRWQCWASIYTIFLLQAHAAMPWVAPHAPAADAVIIDAPVLATHWPKFVLWFLSMVISIAFAAVLEHDHKVGRIPLQPAVSVAGTPPRSFTDSFAQRCNSDYNCKLDDRALAIACVNVALLLLMLLTWCYYILRALREISKRSYNDHRMGNLTVRLQIRNKGYAVLFFLISMILLFYVNLDSCASYSETIVGLLPMQICLSVISIGGCFAYMPQSPGRVQPVLQIWLQTFAWSEEGKLRKMRHRARATRFAPQLAAAPMFCFETAMAMFYWSALVYRYESEQVRANDGRYTLAAGMKVLNLDHFELLWEKREDTKVLMAWSPTRLVISFRGTASWANVWADLQTWMHEHPPRRGRGTFFYGSRPCVHNGFLRSWLANGLQSRVLQRIEEIEEGYYCRGQRPSGPRRVTLTGHSLGGALATLAAYDIAKAFPSFEVSCYTFGAPRTGNHAFAKDYNQVVPDTWSVINDQDAVTRAAKFGIFKRPGHRVLINSRGDMLVRPSFVETSLRNVPWGSSARDHLLSNYKASLIAIMLAQFDRHKGFADGMQGMMKMAQVLEAMKPEKVTPHTEKEMELRKRLDGLMAMPRLGAAMAVGAALDEAKDASEAAAAFLHRASAFRCVAPSTDELDTLREEGEENDLLPEGATTRPSVSGRRSMLSRLGRASAPAAPSHRHTAALDREQAHGPDSSSDDGSEASMFDDPTPGSFTVLPSAYSLDVPARTSGSFVRRGSCKLQPCGTPRNAPQDSRRSLDISLDPGPHNTPSMGSRTSLGDPFITPGSPPTTLGRASVCEGESSAHSQSVRLSRSSRPISVPGQTSGNPRRHSQDSNFGGTGSEDNSRRGRLGEIANSLASRVPGMMLPLSLPRGPGGGIVVGDSSRRSGSRQGGACSYGASRRSLDIGAHGIRTSGTHQLVDAEPQMQQTNSSPLLQPLRGSVPAHSPPVTDGTATCPQQSEQRPTPPPAMGQGHVAGPAGPGQEQGPPIGRISVGATSLEAGGTQNVHEGITIQTGVLGNLEEGTVANIADGPAITAEGYWPGEAERASEEKESRAH
eukprot:CAMPEP_0206142186 /NCGR_PEP_ID=MMETSP1473-20131121/15880_1 /ASSEMBLY_ACC=CAM_ASM_001109 /TAXON_ID=1461547 /ORGANISM="Stichococcus sp, Strain RCC1054" /LENGTH=1445 /DNA_ID=CAMNT_0053537075 /DNA_START=238 /DNA_END=4575 /DNA_ORIENTATION=-